ncbi:MAG: MFS transporter [Myxococcota bacterium]|jgi:MFS family permease|nr:MFS transporter [Myxococcota bacterium]
MFYGWVIVAAVFAAQMFMIGFWTYGFPLLVDPVQKEFGASVADIQMGLSAGGILAAVLAPLLGPLVDRWSARGMASIGAVLLVTALVLMSFAQGVYAFVGTVAVVLTGANVLLGPITGSTLVSRWFTTTRGRALGIAATGTSIGGLLIPLLLDSLIASMGWRGSLRALAACVLVFVVPLVVFGLRDHPGDKGLHPDGAEEPPSSADAAASGRVWAVGEVVRSPAYWLIGCCLGMLFMAYTGTLANLHKYATELGVEAANATRLISMVAITGFIGKLLFGWAADRIGMRVGLWAAIALTALGIGTLSLEPGYAGMLVATALMGLAAGGMLPVWSGMIGEAFGVASFGLVMGLMMPIITVFAAPAPTVAGLSFDQTQSYSLAMQCFVGVLIVAAALLVPLRLDQNNDKVESTP